MSGTRASERSYVSDQSELIQASFYASARDPRPTPWRGSYASFYKRLETFPVRQDITDTIRRELAAFEAAAGGGQDAPVYCRKAKEARTYQEALAGLEGQKREKQLTRWRSAIPRRAKACLPAWSPAIIRPGATRAGGNVEALSAIVLDYDGGDYTVAEALSPWAGWEAFAHTSWSHTPEHPKFRLVLPLVQVLPVALWKRAWAWAWEQSGKLIDPVCKDPSRIYFLPATPSKEAHTEAGFHAGERLLLTKADLPVLPEKPKPVFRYQPVRVPPRLAQAAILDRLKHDPGAREEVAVYLEARIVGNKARFVACPQCGQRSVWWWLEAQPGQMRQARCNHKDNCGWGGWLDQLAPELLQGVA